MSYVRIWIHLVFSTKNREPILTPEIRKELYSHIAENAKSKEIILDSINGYSDHLHCLLLLGKDNSISNTPQLIKGESSFWLNNKKYFNNKFHWQDDYWAVSVSESHINSVREYILKQEEHHKVKTFTEEVELFMKKYNYQYVKE